MEMVPYRKRRESALARFQDSVNDLFNRFFENWDVPLPLSESAWMPAVDVIEQEDSISVRAELPGIRPEDLDISIQGSTLTICGEKKEEREEKEENYRRMERRYGNFRRLIALPADVDPESTEATYRDGVLNVTVCKTEQAKPRKVKVNVAEPAHV